RHHRTGDDVGGDLGAAHEQPHAARENVAKGGRGLLGLAGARGVDLEARIAGGRGGGTVGNGADGGGHGILLPGYRSAIGEVSSPGRRRPGRRGCKLPPWDSSVASWRPSEGARSSSAIVSGRT